jgi:DNA gyrase subunit B
LLNLNLKDKLKLNLEREVVSPVSQAVSEMIEIIWKKIQMMLESLFKSNSCSASVTPLKAREMVQRKTVMGGGGLQGKLSDCSEQDPANAKCILSIRQGNG